MRIFALSDVHIDYGENARWIAGLSDQEFKDDVILLAGDISDSLALVEWCFRLLARKFAHVLFVPGNHDLWIQRDPDIADSIQKLERILRLARECNVCTDTFCYGELSIVPLLAWYDSSFGEPSHELQAMWMDYRACVWPVALDPLQLSSYFSDLNARSYPPPGQRVISFSHFVPRKDLVPVSASFLYPVLGTSRLEAEMRRLRSFIHVYGHSHVNQSVTIDGVLHVNNAFGYPSEHRTAKQLRCIYET
jgi:predicted phosphodiesterase